MEKVQTRSKRLFAFLLALCLLGCAATKNDFNRAQATGTIEAYEEFIRQHPNSEYENVAQKAMAELRKKEIQKEQAEQNRLKAIAKLEGYSVGVTTEEQFFGDGWNAKDPFLGRTGILDQISQNLVLVSVTLGYWDSFHDAFGDQMQSDYNYVFAKTDGIKTVYGPNVEGEVPNRVCVLTFTNGLMESLEWLNK